MYRGVGVARSTGGSQAAPGQPAPAPAPAHPRVQKQLGVLNPTTQSLPHSPAGPSACGSVAAEPASEFYSESHNRHFL